MQFLNLISSLICVAIIIATAVVVIGIWEKLLAKIFIPLFTSAGLAYFFYACRLLGW